MKKIILACVVLIAPSCASLMTGGSDSVTVQSVPAGAYFSTNTGVRGRTPRVVTVPASEDLIVEFKLRGYESTNAVVESRLSGWVIGNIVFGGFIGLAIDLINPDSRTHNRSVTVTLVKSEGADGDDEYYERPKSALEMDFEAARERRRNLQ